MMNVSELLTAYGRNGTSTEIIRHMRSQQLSKCPNKSKSIF